MAKRKKKPLAELRRRFVEAYMGPAAGNATKAAELAGYSKKTAYSQGSRLLKNVEVLHAIEARVKACPIVADKKRRQRFWSSIMEGEGHFVTLKMRDRLRASELLGKSAGDFALKVELEAGKSLADLIASTAPGYKPPAESAK